MIKLLDSRGVGEQILLRLVGPQAVVAAGDLRELRELRYLGLSTDDVQKLIQELKKTNPFVEKNIFKSVENVNLSTVIAYKKDGVKHHFLEDYDV